MNASGRHASTVYAVARNPAWRKDRPPGPLIGGSWQRCVDQYGLDPGRIDADVLPHHELLSRRQQASEVVAVARPEMQSLAEQLAGAGYALLLTDMHGFILCHQSERRLEADFRAAGLWDGANWSETHQGTNGIGTALVERRALTVHCADHFAARNTALSCSAAPIQAPDGSLLGVLDASSVQCEASRASQLHTMALVRMSARVIEKQLFLNAWRGCWILRFHSRPEFVNLVQDGMLAVDDACCVRAADSGAALQLGLDDRNALVGRELASLFDPAPSLWGPSGPAHGTHAVRETRRGRRYFACLHPARALGPRRTVTQTEQRKPDALDRLAGTDAGMCRIAAQARRVVDRNITVMLQGETGTGKEAFARALHAVSQRADKPFVAVNCAAIPETLIESELFGYAPGAFTGARREGAPGLITHASGGTLFLDEIGDMPLALQTRLLRVLEQREVTPLGSVDTIAVDLNLISATHACLRDQVAAGRFRADLYYRLNGIELTLPPVRRRDDCQALLMQVLAQATDAALRFEPDALQALLAHDWPGNIRQMQNVLSTAAALSNGACVALADLPPDIAAPVLVVPAAASATPLEMAESNALRALLNEHGWNVSACARRLGMSRNTLYRKLRRHGIQARAYRRQASS